MFEKFTDNQTADTTVRRFQEKVYEWAKAKGWAEKEINVPEMVALIHSEASEALESFRKHEPVSFTVEGKPEGIASEFADIFIRVLHYSSVLGIDLEAETIRKMEYNWTREHRHGGKAV